MTIMSEITALEKKIDSHVERQEKFNELVSQNLKELTKVNTEIKVFQVEVNNLAGDVREVKDDCSKQSERISAVERAIVLVERYDGIFKKVFASVITSAILVAGSAVAYVMFIVKV